AHLSADSHMDSLFCPRCSPKWSVVEYAYLSHPETPHHVPSHRATSLTNLLEDKDLPPGSSYLDGFWRIRLLSGRSSNSYRHLPYCSKMRRLPFILPKPGFSFAV